MTSNNDKMDNRSKDFIFIPFCLLSQAFHAQGLVKYEWRGTLRPIMEELIKKDVNIIQMPCPETLFFGIKDGLKRKPLGIEYYDTPEFRKHCLSLAESVVKIIEEIIQAGYQVIGILGIEYSPSCAVELQYTPRGIIHKKGIFINELQKLLKKRSITIPFVGVNRRGIKKSIEKINALFQEATKQSFLF